MLAGMFCTKKSGRVHCSCYRHRGAKSRFFPVRASEWEAKIGVLSLWGNFGANPKSYQCVSFWVQSPEKRSCSQCNSGQRLQLIEREVLFTTWSRGIFSSSRCNWVPRALLAAANKMWSELNGHTSVKHKFELYVYPALINVSTTPVLSLHHESSRAVLLTSLRKTLVFNSTAKIDHSQKSFHLYKEEKKIIFPQPEAVWTMFLSFRIPLENSVCYSVIVL